MRRGVGVSQRVQTGVSLRVDPKVVLGSYILQLTQHELEQAIESELMDNPALERLQDDADPITEEAILKVVAPQELRSTREDFESVRSLPREDGVDWTELAASTPTLEDHLRAQLLPSLDKELRPLGETVLGCLNEKGYLTLPVEEIALMTGATIEQVNQVLEELHKCEPAGIGAIDVRECLLLQLRDADTIETKLARAILKHYMDDLMARRTTRIMRRYGVLPEVVEAAFNEILQLNPYPGETFSNIPTVSGLSSRATAVTPDLILRLTESGWEIEATGPDSNSFSIERSYRDRQRELQAGRSASGEEKKHVSDYIQRASNFIQSLSQRKKTLRRIGEYLVQSQAGFVTTGRYEFLQQLTRTKLARGLGIHESTVSRATTGKFVQIANGEVVPFDIFFKPAIRVQKMIEEILQNENPQNPLSDEAISEILRSKGIVVARRTVNKYRDKGRLLSSRRRRSA